MHADHPPTTTATATTATAASASETDERAEGERAEQEVEEERHSGGGVHRRYDMLRGSWVLVCPHRARRPWLGHQSPVCMNLRERR
jgi:Galactose-1-phosphate uridyl transferase, N-terminal domain